MCFIMYRTWVFKFEVMDSCLVQAVGESLELLEAIVHAADISNPCKSQTHIGHVLTDRSGKI